LRERDDARSERRSETHGALREEGAWHRGSPMGGWCGTAMGDGPVRRSEDGR
jgi:hypothetical protein